VEIIRSFQDDNVAQIQFSGGEPMSRYNDLLHLLRTARSGTDFWMNTSGFLLDQKRAEELKSAGLTGCIISLDHYMESGHIRFRKNPSAFKWAIEATRAAVNAGMPVTLSLCATREFISWENMLSYAAMARDLGVTFIQVLEPKPTGFYKGKDVKLDQSQKQILEDFYWRMAFDPQYRDWPIVNYHEYHRHAINCGGAGDRFLYINSVGGIQACPFCDKSFGHILKGDSQHCIQHMRQSGCSRLD
jgi:MoaA/NifB/PqqE/SkfB family radical SAM enzyme